MMSLLEASASQADFHISNLVIFVLLRKLRVPLMCSSNLIIRFFHLLQSNILVTDL